MKSDLEMYEGVYGCVEDLRRLDEEILMLVYNEGWNKAMDEVDEDLRAWNS